MYQCMVKVTEAYFMIIRSYVPIKRVCCMVRGFIAHLTSAFSPHFGDNFEHNL